MAKAFGLRGRRREQEALDRLLRDVRAGHSRVLVLRGEAGAGKTALLDHLIERATACRVTRTAGAELETEIAYAPLQQLCAPLLGHLDRLPGPQRDALATAFGLGAGEPPAMLLVALAVLGLFAEAAADQPLVCVVDDAQWLDRMSEVILMFVARRLDAESVALVFAARADDGAGPAAPGLPELPVGGLADADARALLDSVLTAPVDDQVRDRIVAETRGNPLALLELPRGRTAAELAFGFGGPDAAPPAGRTAADFERRIAGLPDDSRRLLRTAAVEPVGDLPLLWRAMATQGIGPAAAEAAEAAGLIEFGARVRFRHPLVRSAAWRSGTAEEQRAAHRALAEVTDPGQDPDRRAWHRAHATLGFADDVAGELESSADRALSRGGRAAAAAFLERAAELTADPKRRAARLLRAAQAHADAGAPARVPGLLATAELTPLDPVQRAGAERLRAHVASVTEPGRGAVAPLLAAAGRLAGLDTVAARDTYLQALGAALDAGRLGPGDLRRVAETARSARPGPGFPGLLLTGLVTWVLDGPAAAAAPLRRALAAVDTDADLVLLPLAAPAAAETGDLATGRRITERATGFARRTGALALLPTALDLLAADRLAAGRFDDAASLIDEAATIAAATGVPAPPGAALSLAAHRGRESPAEDLIAATVAGAEARGTGRPIAVAQYARAVLHNGLGNYPLAFAAARAAADHPDFGLLPGTLPELVEAATRAGETAAAAAARDRLACYGAGELALADAQTGPPGRAEAHYRAALELLTGGATDLRRLRARLLFGEWLRRANRRAEARTELRAALDAFTEVGAEAFAERARRELVATGETVRKRVAGEPDQLTAQEAQIVRLAVAGRTNPEIGATLFLSPRTVEWHLRKVFTKLGVTSRRELAAALRDRP